MSQVLSPAIALWLRSQLDAVKMLQVKLDGGDRQLLTGHIPRAEILAEAVVYQSIHLRQVRLIGSNIRINLGQIIRGKPFRLLHPIRVEVEAGCSEADLSASFNAPAMTLVVMELLQTLLSSDDRQHDMPTQQSGGPHAQAVHHFLYPNADAHPRLDHLQVKLGENGLTCSGDLVMEAERFPLSLQTEVTIARGRWLQFKHLHCSIQTSSQLVQQQAALVELDLGSDVELQQLILTPQQVKCQATLKVLPAEES